MCGILGGFFLELPALFKKNISSALNSLKHRGPDDDGYEVFDNSAHGQVVLGHTRLSVIDLSILGHQPMNSSDGRYSIVFNGEIYNYRELRQELAQIGYIFKSDSDTEVLLTAWREWGAACLPRFVGMFAFVVYDKYAQTLTCVRDPFGIKPFFYLNEPDRFLFASEQPALLALNGRKSAVDWQRSYDFLIYGDYDSNERTFIANVKHLLAGQMLVMDLVKSELSDPIIWWTPKISIRQNLSFNQAAEEVQEQFLQNIRLHLRSDVPLGAALSGGIDSSAVVCAMRHLQPDLPIHTFSFIAQGSDISEENWVNRVNQHVNAIPHKFVATASELTHDLDDMLRAQGEPFGSTSIYAQYRVFKLAKASGITVTLDGQGADELLAGYHGYPGERLLSLLEQGRLLESLQFAANWSHWPGRDYKRAWMQLCGHLLSEKLYNYAGKLIGRSSLPTWLNTDLLQEAGVSLKETRMSLAKQNRGRRVVERLSISLQQKGLPELLRHGDRNSMRFGVESRVPFLTIPMADLLLSLPENYLISSQGETKSVFRAAMRNIVPDDILDRKDKIGFETPEKNWLLSMTPMIRNWLQDSDQIPFLNRDALLTNFNAIADGKAPFTWQVWRWVNFVKWYNITV